MMKITLISELGLISSTTKNPLKTTTQILTLELNPNKRLKVMTSTLILGLIINL